MVRRPAEQTREHVLDVATELFYRQGIRSTGVDVVARAADVAPTTLYRVFGNKDGLVDAYLDRMAARYRQWFEQQVAAGVTPRDRLLLAVDGALAQVEAPDCLGCPFQRGLAELLDPQAPGHRRAQQLKEWVRGRLGAITAELPGVPPADAEVLADQVFLVVEGMYAAALAFRPVVPAQRAHALVEALVSAATR